MLFRSLAEPLVIGGVRIDPGSGGGDPHFLFIDNQHPSITGQAIMANHFAAGLNVAYGGSIAPFSDLEILGFGGIADEFTGETLSPTQDYASYVLLPPPPPSCAAMPTASPRVDTALAYLVAGAAFLIRARRKQRTSP